MSQYDRLFRMPLGMEVEGEFYGCIRKYCRNTNQLNKFKGVNGSRLDVEQGTDCMIGPMRVDFTCNYSGKDHMIKLPDKIHIEKYNIDICFGIRTGNNHHCYTPFKKNVVVIGFDCDTYYLRTNMDGIFKEVDKLTSKIICLANKAYKQHVVVAM